MTESLWTRTLADFRDRTASSSPAPAGGAAAAVTAALGLGLVLMSLEITRQGAHSEDAAALGPLLTSGRALLERLSAHADQDVAVVNAYMAALALPKGTAKEKEARGLHVQETLAAAAESPLAAARDIAAALDLAAQAAEPCKPQILSDLAAGVDLLAASLTAVLRNVDVNLPGLSDVVLRERMGADRAALAASAGERIAVVQSPIERRLHNETQG